MPDCGSGAFASSSDLLFGSHLGCLQAETLLSALCRFTEPPLKSAVTEKLPCSRNFWSEQRRALPGLVIAYASGATAGVAFGSQFEGGTKFFAFLVTYLSVSAFLRYIVFRRQCCPSNDDGPVGISRYMFWGLTEFGILMAAGLSGGNFLEAPHSPGYMAIQIGISIFVSALAGVAFGASLYVFNRLAERHQPNPD